MITTNIPRTPNDCDADIKAVCEDVKLQNELGNRLKEFEIGNNEITLKYE